MFFRRLITNTISGFQDYSWVIRNPPFFRVAQLYLYADNPAIFFLSVQDKSKKAKAAKPAEDPPVLASDPARPPSPLTGALEDPPIVNEANPPEPSFDEATMNPSTVGPSRSTDPPYPRVQDVQITGSHFVEPGNPTVLARCTARQEAWRGRKFALTLPTMTISMPVTFYSAISVMYTPVASLRSRWSSSFS